MMSVRIKSQFSLSLIALVVAVGAVRGNPEVKVINSTYSCCERKIEFNQQCDNIFSTNNKPFAYSKGGSKKCVPPCEKIEDYVMMLDECVAVNATVVCTDEMNLAVEEKISHYTQPCSGSRLAPGNQGSVGVSLLAVAIGGLFVNQVIVH